MRPPYKPPVKFSAAVMSLGILVQLGVYFIWGIWNIALLHVIVVIVLQARNQVLTRDYMRAYYPDLERDRSDTGLLRHGGLARFTDFWSADKYLRRVARCRFMMSVAGFLYWMVAVILSVTLESQIPYPLL